MKGIMRIITELGNIQRDRAFKEEEKRKTVRKGDGFGEILRKEEEKLGNNTTGNNG